MLYFWVVKYIFRLGWATNYTHLAHKNLTSTWASPSRTTPSLPGRLSLKHKPSFWSDSKLSTTCRSWKMWFFYTLMFRVEWFELVLQSFFAHIVILKRTTFQFSWVRGSTKSGKRMIMPSSSRSLPNRSSPGQSQKSSASPVPHRHMTKVLRKIIVKRRQMKCNTTLRPN